MVFVNVNAIAETITPSAVAPVTGPGITLIPQIAKIDARSVTKKKEPFAIRHPKLHKLGRKIRKDAQVIAATLAPYFNILTGVMETLVYFKH
jgi:hypothetical protein